MLQLTNEDHGKAIAEPEAPIINPEIQNVLGRLRKLANQDKPGKFIAREIDRVLDDLEYELKLIDNPEEYADSRIAEITEDSALIPNDIMARMLEYLDDALESDTWDMAAFNLKKDITWETQGNG